MTTTFVFTCVLWTNTTFTQIFQVPVSEYGTAQITQQVGGFKYDADVIEEKVNSVKITHIASGAKASAYTMEWPQNTLVARLEIGDEQSSMDCDIKRQAQP